MSRPADLTAIYFRETNGVLMGVFMDIYDRPQYTNGLVTTISDTAAWWAVPGFTQRQGVTQSGYYYVYREDGYHRCNGMSLDPSTCIAKFYTG